MYLQHTYNVFFFFFGGVMGVKSAIGPEMTGGG